MSNRCTRARMASAAWLVLAAALALLPAGWAGAQASLPAIAIKTAADGA